MEEEKKQKAELEAQQRDGEKREVWRLETGRGGCIQLKINKSGALNNWVGSVKKKQNQKVRDQTTVNTKVGVWEGDEHTLVHVHYQFEAKGQVSLDN